MPRQSKIISATGVSAPLALDTYQKPFNVSVFLEIQPGSSVNCALQYTGSDLNDATWTPVWLTDTVNIPTGTTTSEAANFAFPVSAVRLNVASITGSVRLVTMQGL